VQHVLDAGHEHDQVEVETREASADLRRVQEPQVDFASADAKAVLGHAQARLVQVDGSHVRALLGERDR
jgi:hypothetical protein